jgi:hypothetical protein
MNKFNADIDIDFADREQILKLIKYTPATINRNGEYIKHNTGVYVNPIPANPFTGLSNIDYQTAEEMGYVKLDLLNVNVYNQVRNEQHLNKLISTEPMWEMLQHKEFVEQVIHINNHYDLLQKMPEPVNSITRMAMFIALIRPGKRHLVGKSWREVSEHIWDKTEDVYSFKKSHSCAYAHLVIVHMNLLTETSD